MTNPAALQSADPRPEALNSLGTTTAQIDSFYDWIYARGLARLAARGITPQMLYAQLHGEGR
jgi:hypothetical protein